MDSDLVTLPVHFLDGGVVSVLVGHEEGGLDIATVRILPFSVEDLFVETDVVVVDSVVEGDSDHLWDVLRWQVARNHGSILGAEAIGKDTDHWVTRGCSVGVVVHVCNFGHLDCPYSLTFNGIYFDRQSSICRGP